MRSRNVCLLLLAIGTLAIAAAPFARTVSGQALESATAMAGDLSEGVALVLAGTLVIALAVLLRQATPERQPGERMPPQSSVVAPVRNESSRNVAA